MIHKFSAGLLSMSLLIIPAQASEGSSDAGVSIIAPLEITMSRGLDFGTLAPHATEAGHVTVKTYIGNSQQCSQVTCMTPGGRAEFTVTGAPGRMITLPRPADIMLTNGNGDTMSVTNFNGAGSGDANWVGVVQIGSNGTAFVGVGGQLSVAANQAVGAYTGTFTLTAEYQ